MIIELQSAKDTVANLLTVVERLSSDEATADQLLSDLTVIQPIAANDATPKEEATA